MTGTRQQAEELIAKHGGYELVAKLLQEALQAEVTDDTLLQLEAAVKAREEAEEEERARYAKGTCNAHCYQQMEYLTCDLPANHVGTHNWVW